MWFWKVYFIVFALFFIIFFIHSCFNLLKKQRLKDAFIVFLRHLMAMPLVLVLYLYSFKKVWLDIFLWRVYFFLMCGYTIYRIFLRKPYIVKQKFNEKPLLFFLAVLPIGLAFWCLLLYTFFN